MNFQLPMSTSSTIQNRKRFSPGLRVPALGLILLAGCFADAASLQDDEFVSASSDALCRTGSYWPNKVVPVCWTAAAQANSSFAVQSVAIRAVVEATWPRVANVKITGWGNCATNTNGIVAMTLTNGVRPASGTIGYTTGAINMQLDPLRGDFRAVAVHEFGHVLGYRHEFVRSDNTGTTCPLQNGESVDKTCDYETTNFDPASIMAATGYCQNNVSLSAFDVLGALEGYGGRVGYVSGAISQDYDGDRKADQVLFRGTKWYVRPSAGGADIVTTFGLSTDLLVPGDYDGDRKTDRAVFRPSEGKWYVQPSAGGADIVTTFGNSTDVLVPADYDGDGKTDRAVFRPSEGKWYVRPSAGGADIVTLFGTSKDVVLPGDYDGDGKADRALFRPLDATWYVRRSAGGADLKTQFGIASDIALPADYDGDKKADFSVFRPSNNTWYVRRSDGAADMAIGQGQLSDRFLPADYTGDGRADFATYRPADNFWRIRTSGSTATRTTAAFGLGSDVYPNSK